MATTRGRSEIESTCSLCRIEISKTDVKPSADLETMLSLLQTECKLYHKKLKIKSKMMISI